MTMRTTVIKHSGLQKVITNKHESRWGPLLGRRRMGGWEQKATRENNRVTGSKFFMCVYEILKG